MRVFVTGGTGFIGGYLVRELVGRGDVVVAAVRDAEKAARLTALGCETSLVDLHDVSAVTREMRGCDAVYHLAGYFKIGVPTSQRDAMQRTNVQMTADVIDAATSAGVERIVYASTINVFGDTRGAVVDETFKRKGDFLSIYDESKHRAHEVALARIADGAPLVIVQPGVVYGRGDHFETGRQILLASQGRLPLSMFGDLGITMAHVEDVASGMIAARDKGRIGESYVLAGEVVRLRELLQRAATVGGRRFRSLEVPTPLLRALAPLGPRLGPRLGYPPNFRELIRASDGVTYWASSDKAMSELDYRPTPLDEGLRRTIASSA